MNQSPNATSVCFSNPGEIDVRLITTLGVNVKNSDSPIGYFGTGLKYAIAVLIREGQKIEVWSGETVYSFFSSPQEIRGKTFNFINMTTAEPDGQIRTETLGFTTELGKNWTLQNAYRELHSNCLDEGGAGGLVLNPGSMIHTGPEFTSIIVTGKAFVLTHIERYEDILLDPASTRLGTSPKIEFYAGVSSHVYYRGISIFKLPSQLSCTVNLLSDQELTEDRVLKHQWGFQMFLGDAIATVAPVSVIKNFITNRTGYERYIDISGFVVPSADFKATVKKAMEQHPSSVLDNVASWYLRWGGGKLNYKTIKLDAEQKLQLNSAIVFCCSTGFPVTDYEIIPVEGLGEGILAMAKDDQILLSLEVFKRDLLERALIEEYIHLKHLVGDYTRAMQNVLIGEIIRLGKLKA